MEHYHPAWLIDKPRTTVAWNKFASSCFCLPGFRQLAHRAGRSMSGLRDDAICESTRNVLIQEQPTRSCSYESLHGNFQGDSVVSDMTESEVSCLVSLSDHEATSIDLPRLPPILPRKNSNQSIKGFPPKPPVSPHKPGSSNRSFVTTGSSFCSVASSSKRSSSSFHKRTLPMHYNDSYQACVDEALSEPKSPWRSQQQQVFVVRNRLDSEISALEMESQTSDGRRDEENSNENHDLSEDDNNDDDDDSMGYSPFPLLQHKGDNWSPMMTHRKGSKRRPLKPLPPPPFQPPPPPPPSRRHTLIELPQRGKGRVKTTDKKYTFRRRRRQSEPTMELPKQRRPNVSDEPTDFLCKNPFLEELPLLLPKRASCKTISDEPMRKKVIASGWIVVLFGEAAVEESTRSLCSSSHSSGSPALGFGPGDLYYLRIVQDSSFASLVLHRSTDGKQEHFFPIQATWTIESKESQDRRVGRSISIRGREFFLKLIPVALKDTWKAKLDQNLRETQPTGSCDGISVNTAFVLPHHGRFAPDAQLDTARHLFFTIDSFAKQQR